MKFTVKAGALAAETGLLLTLASKRTSTPICNTILIRADASGLTLTATDLDALLRVHAGAEVAEPGAVAIPAARLDGLLRAFPRDAVVAFTLGGNNWLSINGPGSKLRMGALNADDFPSISEKPDAESSVMPAAALAELLRRTSFAGHESDVCGFGGMYFQIQKGKATAGATNGNRACIGSDATAAADILIMADRPSFDLVSRLLRDVGGDVAVACDTSRAWFTIAGRELALRHQNERAVPPLPAMLKKYGDTSEPFLIEAKAFIAALRRAELLAPAAKAEKDVATQVDLRVSTSGLSIAAESPDGVAEETIPVAYAGEPYEASFSAAFLRDFLSAAASERVSVRMPTNPQNAVIMNDGDGHVYMCMPMHKPGRKGARG